MKKMIAVMLLALCIFAVTACGNNDTENESCAIPDDISSSVSQKKDPL